MKVEEIRLLLVNAIPDQEGESKTDFLRIAKVGPPTRLAAIGISNGSVKKLARQYYADNKAQPFEHVLGVADELFRDAKYVEEHMFLFYLLEMYRKSYTSDLFPIVDGWIDLVDHWISSDHIAINVMKHYPVGNHLDEIYQWVDSSNFWRRRQALTIFLKHLKSTKVAETVIALLDLLKEDRNYYVRKAFPWVMREMSKSHPELVQPFMITNIDFFTKTEVREASKYLEGNEKIIELYEQAKRK